MVPNALPNLVQQMVSYVVPELALYHMWYHVWHPNLWYHIYHTTGLTQAPRQTLSEISTNSLWLEVSFRFWYWRSSPKGWLTDKEGTRHTPSYAQQLMSAVSSWELCFATCWLTTTPQWKQTFYVDDNGRHPHASRMITLPGSDFLYNISTNSLRNCGLSIHECHCQADCYACACFNDYI